MQNLNGGLNVDKKGLGAGLITVIVMVVILVFLMLIFFAWSLTGPLLTSLIGEVSGDITDVMNQAPAPTPETNLTQINEVTNVVFNDSVQQLEWITYAIFGAVILTFLVMAYYVRTYPFMLGIWIVTIILLVFLSLFMTYTYEQTKQDAYLNGIYSTWATNDFIISNMPIIILILGVLGGIFMFAVVTRDSEYEQQVL